MARVLITGSREATVEMQVIAAKTTRRLIRRGHFIIVGDADGIDDIVIGITNLYEYAKVSVYGAYKKMKRRTSFGLNIPVDGSYPYRDELMALETDVCLSVWNGISRGTKITFDCARKLKKPVYHLWKAPSRQKVRRIR